MVTGEFRGWIQRLALEVDPFFRKTPFHFLGWAGCDSRHPKGWILGEARVALCIGMAPRLLL